MPQRLGGSIPLFGEFVNFSENISYAGRVEPPTGTYGTRPTGSGPALLGTKMILIPISLPRGRTPAIAPLRAAPGGGRTPTRA